MCSSGGGGSGKRKDRMKLSLPPKLAEKLVWVPAISFCKNFTRLTSRVSGNKSYVKN
jgi:hypothetical protein